MKCHTIPVSSFKKIKNGIYNILIADSLCEKYQGLRQIPYLSKDTLMLFTNIGPGVTFTTQDCFMSLDIVPLNSNNQILDLWSIRPNISNIGPTPLQTVKVIEAPIGYFRRNGWDVGDILLFLKF